ncbi:UNVERIFIED_CONTAM: Ureide permease 1 [Sesamum indicum]
MDYFGIPTVVSIPSERIVFSGLKMYVVESKGGAIACMLLALFFLGTWPAILTLLERRGRLPQHTYLDYTITNLLAAVIIAFTFGEIGKSTIEKPNFINQLSQDNWPSVLFAMAGGIVLSLGNLATQYAWAFVGLSVTEVITSSITVVIGTTLNYFLDDKINKAEILFPGVGCFLIAVCFGSAVHSSNAADNKAKLTSFSNDSKARAQGYVFSTGLYFRLVNVLIKDLENGTATKEKAEFGTAHFLIELENKRAIKVFGKGTFIGLAITFFAGVCFSLFSPAFNLATNDQWHTLQNDVPHLSVYTAFFYFSVSCFVIAIILNISFLYRPVLNLPKSSFKAYLSDWNGRGWALLAGFLCGFGNGLQFMGGQAAGYAAADAVQALPLVSTFWGILLFGEYRRSSRRTYALLVGMLSMFIIAVGVLMASSGHHSFLRKDIQDLVANQGQTCDQSFLKRIPQLKCDHPPCWSRNRRPSSLSTSMLKSRAFLANTKAEICSERAGPFLSEKFCCFGLSCYIMHALGLIFLGHLAGSSHSPGKTWPSVEDMALSNSQLQQKQSSIDNDEAATLCFYFILYLILTELEIEQQWQQLQPLRRRLDPERHLCLNSCNSMDL